MAQFYGTLQGARGMASRLGTKSSGLRVYGAGWTGGVAVDIWHDTKTGRDMFHVSQVPHYGAGVARTIASGVLGGPAELTAESEESDNG